jgi:dihydropyrimidinase
MKTIIKNGCVVTTEGVYKADVAIERETITALAQGLNPEAGDLVIDAEGQYVFPGGIDVHTHLANNSVDDFRAGSIASAVGGTTSVVNMTKPRKGQSLMDYWAEWKEKAAPSVIDYGFHLTISGSDYRDSVLEELSAFVEAGGIASLKLFMAYKGRSMVNDTQMYRVMKKAAELRLVVNVHAENGDVIEEMIADALSMGHTSPVYHAYTRPPLVEAEATERALSIAEAAGATVYIVHVSCSDALERIERAKKRGVKAYAETCTHYLALNTDRLKLPDFEGAKYVCSPPLREQQHVDALWKGIAAGQISVVGSDHSPFHFATQKSLGKDNFAKIPNGVPGIEDRFAVMYHLGVHERRITLETFVDVMCTAPAKIFGMLDKGSVAVGKDADLVILDPNRSRVITQKEQLQTIDYNLYEGMHVQGYITHVLSRGEVIAKEGRFTGSLGRGRYLHRTRF